MTVSREAPLPPLDGSGHRWLLPILVGACVLVSADLSLQLTRHTGSVAAIWVSNAIVLAAFLRTPVSRWTWLALADVAATLMVSVLNGNPLPIACGFAGCNLVEVLICAAPLRGIARQDGALDLARARHLAAFAFVALGPASLCSAALAAGLLAALTHVDGPRVFFQWYAPHALGLLTLTPVLISLEPGALTSLFDRRHLARTAGCLLVMAATLGLVFSQAAYPLLFLTFPALMLMNFQLGFQGVVIALAMTVAVAIGATTKGTGPLLLIHGGLREQVLILQAYIAVAALTSLQLAAVLTGQARLQADLRRANAEAIGEIAARAASEGRAEAARRDAEAAREEAIAANQAKSDFLAAVSHEIRTPLNSIIGFTDLMLGGTSQSGVARQYTEIVRSAGSALLTIVNDVLDFSRLEAGDIELDATPFALRTLCANVMAIIGGIATTKDLDITSIVDPRLPDTLVGDASRLQQVLLNLLNNAVKFTAKGRVELRIELEGWADGRARMRFSVSDTGIGIEEAKARPPLQALQSGGRVRHPHLRRVGARLGDLQTARRADGRRDRAVERARARLDVLVPRAAAPRRRTARGRGRHHDGVLAVRTAAPRRGRRGQPPPRLRPAGGGRVIASTRWRAARMRSRRCAPAPTTSS